MAAQLALAFVGGLLGVALATPLATPLATLLAAGAVVLVTMVYLRDLLGRRDVGLPVR